MRQIEVSELIWLQSRHEAHATRLCPRSSAMAVTAQFWWDAPWTLDASRKSPKSQAATAASLGFPVLFLALVSELFYDGYALFGGSNGRLISFLKSVHSANYYYPKSRHLARSLIGSLILKFAGSTVLSLAISELPIWLTSPRHVTSFVLAWCLVRSSSTESAVLADAVARRPLLAAGVLNGAAALYKLRKLVFLVEATTARFSLPLALALGVLVFSTSNLVLAAEHMLLPAQPADAADRVTPPNLRQTFVRNVALVGGFIAARRAGEWWYLAAKLAALAFLAARYSWALLDRCSAAEEKAKAERRAARPRTPGHAYPVAERKGPPGERKASSAPGSPRVPSYDSTIDMNLDAAREALEAVGEEDDASALRRRHVPPFSLKD